MQPWDLSWGENEWRKKKAKGRIKWKGREEIRWVLGPTRDCSLSHTQFADVESNLMMKRSFGNQVYTQSETCVGARMRDVSSYLIKHEQKIRDEYIRQIPL
jgi:hypothetical protein